MTVLVFMNDYGPLLHVLNGTYRKKLFKIINLGSRIRALTVIPNCP